MTLAKALGDGFPSGRCSPEGAPRRFVPGTTAPPSAAIPLAMAASLATLSIMLRDNIAPQASQKGAYLMEKLQGLKRDHPALKTVRGRGLMVGAEFDADISFMPASGLKHGIMLNVIQGSILRLVPPLVISTAEMDGP